MAKVDVSGNKRIVTVKVLGDVKVNESNWNADMILGDRPENDPAYKNFKPGTNTERGAVFEVMLPFVIKSTIELSPPKCKLRPAILRRF